MDPVDVVVRRPRIVVVEDEPSVRWLFGRLIKAMLPGAEVLEGGTGLDAIALRFAEPPPDLMFVNWSMPDLDGTEAVLRIRAREREDGLSRMPIVFEAGWSYSVLGPAVAECIDAYLEKPFTATAFREVLARYLAAA
jgi:CheY-like chemotaxis protein